jgi:type III restriction enzyme
MKSHFDPDLEFQNQAIDAAFRLFKGAPRQETGFALVSENGVVGNRLLDDEALLANLWQVQTDPDLHNGTPIPVFSELGSRDFSVEMETGTGKTCVYLRAALEGMQRLSSLLTRGLCWILAF